MTRGDKLYESRGGEKFYGDTGEDHLNESDHVQRVIYYLLFVQHHFGLILKKNNIS